MIPKKIHYCWLGKNELPDAIKKTIDTWKAIMPDYELVCWDENKFDINSVACVKDAYNSKRWAFASDYIRLYAVYTEGGIYLDTDVIVRKRFDNFLNFSFFSGIEAHAGSYSPEYPKVLKYRKPLNKIIPDVIWAGINSGIFGAEKGNPLLKDLIDWYLDNQNEIKPSKLDLQTESFEYIAPEIFATIAENYGFDRTKNILQKLDGNMAIFPTSTFGSNANQLSESTYAVHCISGTWRQGKKWYHNPKIRNFLRLQAIEKPKYDFFDAFKKYEEFNFPK